MRSWKSICFDRPNGATGTAQVPWQTAVSSQLCSHTRKTDGRWEGIHLYTGYLFTRALTDHFYCVWLSPYYLGEVYEVVRR